MTASKIKTEIKNPKVVKALKKSSDVKKTAEKKVGLSVAVYGLDGAKKGTIALPESVFGGKINNELMAQAIRVYQVNQRQGTASTKTRGEVQGSTRKIYRQKGTGRARHGGITAPIFVGGGIAFGPRPRTFELKLSKQMRRKALISALALRLSEDKVKIVDASSASGKTAEIYKMFQKMSVLNSKGNGKVLFIPQIDQAKRAAKNIEGVEVFKATAINTYAVLNSGNIVIEKQAIQDLEKLFLN